MDLHVLAKLLELSQMTGSASKLSTAERSDGRFMHARSLTLKRQWCHEQLIRGVGG